MHEDDTSPAFFITDAPPTSGFGYGEHAARAKVDTEREPSMPEDNYDYE